MTFKDYPLRGHEHPFWKGGRKMNDGYVLLKRPEHPRAYSNGYVPEHRLVMEAHLGRYLTHNEHVHHINGNRSDNRLENLIVMSHNDHIRNHCGKPGVDYSKLNDFSWIKSQLDLGLSIRAIARQLGCSHNAVRRTLISQTKTA